MVGFGWNVSAQQYQLRYVTTDSGGITFIGNTLGLAKLTQVNQPGQLDSIGAFITLNTNSQVGTYPKGTTLNWTNDSSAAVLSIPTNATVLYAELIWAGTAQITTNGANVPTGNVLAYLNNPVNFILPNGSSNNITPDPITASVVTNGTVTVPSAIFYVRSANVTSLVQQGGSGTYSAGGIPGCVLATEDNNNACGWTLAVIYEDTLLHQRNLSLFVGNSFASTTATTPAPVGVVGFCSPPTGAVNGYLFVSAIEGDPNKTGDEMLFGPTTNSLAVLSGPNNIANNFFAGQVNYADPDSSSNGLLNMTGTFGLSNSVAPNVGLSARQGWDVTCVNVSSGLTNGIESAYAQNITSGDGYSVDALALQIDVGSPVLTTTQSVDKASTFVGDTLTYTVVITNSGTADAVNLIFNDPLPFGTSFIPNTFGMNGLPVLGADPVSGIPVPIIKQNSSITFTYQVIVGQIPTNAEFITHATINYQYSGPCAESPIINSSLVNANVQTLVPLLNVSKVSTLTNVIPGATFTYTINIPNSGTTNTIDTTLLDPIPIGVTYVANSTTLNGAPVSDLAGGIMSYEVATAVNGPGQPAGQINAGQTAVVTFQVTIAANPPPRINNSATIYANGIQPTTAANAQNNISPVYSDLAAGISASPNPVIAGGSVNFTISVTNNGPSSLNVVTNFVTLYLPIPSSVESPVYTPGSGTYNPLTGVWSGITLAPGGVVTMNVSGTLNPATTSTNLISSVTVSPPPGILDTNTSNNAASTTNGIVHEADLVASITNASTIVYEGSSLTNVVTIVNLGPSTLSSIAVSNFISSNLGSSVVFATEGIFNPADGTWSALSLAAGDSIQLTVVGTVLTVSGSFTNSAIVYPPQGVIDPNMVNNTASVVNMALPLPDTSVLKTGPAVVYADTNFVYTITVTNGGPGTASNVVASDSLPIGTAYVSASGGGTDTAGTVSWNVGTVLPNASSNLTLTVTAPVTAVSLTNTAMITASTPTLNPGNDTSPQVVTTVTPVVDLAIGKTGPPAVVATSNLTYTVSVTNLGPSIASGVVATDTLPTGVTYVSSSGGGVHVGATVGWALGALNVGQITNVTLTLKAPTAAGSITNVATTTSSTLDTNLVNNTSPMVITTVSTLANSAAVTITKTGAPTVTATSNLVYTISITNAGPLAAANVTASDPLPTGAGFVSASGGGANTAGTVNWTIGTLALHANTNLTLTVKAAANGTMTNIASESSTTANPNITNTISPPVLTTVTPMADLGIGKTGASAVLAAANLTYTISVTNFGPSTASSVVVTDTLPAGTIFVSASGGGTTNAGVASWTLPTLAIGATTNFTLTVTAPASGTLVNKASVTSSTTDPVPGNNVSPPVTTTITASADLAIGKSALSVIGATSNLSYTISVTNLGPSSASTVVVTDSLPAGVIFVSASGGGTTNAGVASWSLASFAAGATTNYTLIVTVPTTGTLTNAASVTSPTPDPNLTNNVSPPVTTTVTPSADLAVGKSGTTTVVAGSNISYTISVTNFGPSVASGVVVTDTLPAGVTFMSASGSGADISGVATWSLAALAAGATTNYTLMVTAPASGTLTNTASVSSPIPDPNLPNNVSPPVITTVTPLADLAIGKSATPSVIATSNLTYTVSLTNFGPSTASGAVVTDALPAGVGFVSTTGGGTLSLGVVTWNLATIAAGATTNYTLTVTAAPNGPTTNTASVTSPTPDPNLTNDVSPPVITTVIPLADLAIGKSAPATILAGSNLTYTVTLTNFGPSIASSIIVTDALPAGVIFVSASGGGTTNAGVVSWNLATLAANATTNYTLIVTPPVSGTLTNTASVTSPTPDPNLTNNVTPPVTTTVTPSADLAIGKIGSPTVVATSNLSYTISVTNLGPSAASSVVVTDALPAGVIFVSASGGGTTNAGVASWTLSAFAVGANTNFTLIVNAPANGTLTNTASVTSPTGDPVPTNNVSPPVITTVTPLADLAIGKSGSPTIVATSNLNYTISVTNFGPSSASSVVVTDALPVGVIFVSASGSGTTNAGVASWSLPVFAAGATTNFTLIVTAPTSGTLTNTASVTSPTTDPKSTNNVSPPVITTVTPSADLAVGKSASSIVFATSNLSYTISVTNFGPSSASSVVVTDALPAGVVFVSASGGGTTNAGVASWSLPTFAAGATTNFTLVITAPTSGTLTNKASVTSPTGDPVPTNNVSPPVTTTVTPVADLAIGKSALPTVVATSNLSYTISVTNFGPSIASGVVVTDALPAGVIFVSASGGGTTNAGVASWTLTTFAVGATTNFTLTVTTPASGTLTNTASVSSPTGDPVPTNNVSPPVITTVTPLADLAIGKSGAATVFAASNLTYTVSLTNFGPSTASSVIVTDALPVGVIFVSATGGTTNAGVVSWNLATFPAGTTTNFTLIVTSPASGTLTNTASVTSPTSDPNLTNNVSPPVITPVTPIADLAAFKIGPSNSAVGSTLVYTIIITNLGPSTASGVIATDALPSGFTFVSASGNGVTNGSIVTWNLGTLAANVGTNLTVNVTASTDGLYTNIAEVGSSVIDPNPTNNNGTSPGSQIATSILPVADLGINKFGPANVFAGTNFTYTIVVTNGGPSIASNAVVTDVLPTNVVFSTASSGGVNIAGTVNWPLGNLASNAVTNLTLTVTAPASGVISNTASINSSTPDTNTVNNTSPPVTTSVTPLANLAVGKSGPAGALLNSNYNYTISVTNFGPSIGMSISVTDNLPAGLLFVSASPAAMTNASSQVIWTNIADLPANTVTNLTLTVLPTLRATVTNFALVGTPTLDPSPSNNMSLPAITTITNDPPLANPDVYGTTENTSSTSSPLVNDVLQTPGGTLTIIAVAPTNGTATIVGGTNVFFVPATNFLGTATIGYTITDGIGGTTSSLITITVTNIPPLANPEPYSTTENTGSTSSPLTNDVVETPGGTLTIIAVAPTNGTAMIVGGTNVFFVPATNFLGTATIGYTTTDGIGGTSSSLITITVTNIPPLAHPDTYSAPENTTSTLIPLNNDVVQTPGGTLSIIAVAPTNGTATIIGGTNVMFVPATNFLGTATIGYTITDGIGGASSSLITITVTNRPPLANPDTNSIAENTTNTFMPLTNDVVETPGGTLTIIMVSPTNGTATIIGGTNVMFVPATNFLGTATIGYTITDGIGGTNSSLITVIVTNIPPLANPDTYSAPENTTSTLTPLNNDVVQTPGGTLSIIAIAPTNGTATIIGGTNVMFVPATNFLGTATIGYTITDGIGGTNSSLITVTVTNIPPLANPETNSITENTSTILSPLTNDVVETPGGTLSIVTVDPTNGTATIVGGTNVMFVPATNFLGTATIGYTITDGIGGTNSSLITVTVTNIPPLANPDTYSVTENTTNTLTPLNNDVVETPGGTLSIITVAPTNGTATIIGGTNILFVPATNFLGTATIGYTITDGIGGTSSSLITITVTNRPPLANPDAYSTTENTSSTSSPLTNDVVETPGGILSVVVVNPTNGTATIVGGTNVFFVPATNFLGTATIGYTITDGIGGTNSSLITVTVTNRPPLANPETNSITENTMNTFMPLTNDVVETPGGTLTIIAVTPTNGTATIIGGTNVVFVPGTNFLGTATIGYTITDGIGGTNSSLITVIVTNLPPLANPDTYSVTENTGNTLAPTPLNNDVVETPGGTLSVIVVNPTNGTATIVGGTNVFFVPATNFLGIATIGYTITDGIGGTSSSLITVTVTNVPPLANPETNSITENTSSTLSPLTNDVVETPGGTLSIVTVDPTNGTASIVNGTNIVFVPATNFLGTATIGYTITDGIGGTNSSLITVTVTNIPPLANPDTYSTAENTTNTLTPLNNDVVETPGGTLTIIAVAPTNGTATIIGGTNILFVPATNFLGTATIGYTITDGIGGTNSSLITITVTNRPPLANPDSYGITENTTNTLTPLNNDVLVTPGGTLNIVAVAPTNGTATIIGGTNIVFVPATNFLGTATIGYTITDGIGGTNSSLITVTVTNIPPLANPDTYSVTENTGNTLTPLINDVLETPGGTLSVIVVNPTNGTATIVGGTNVFFVPSTNFLGTATMGYTIIDGIGGTNRSLITITVTNLPPLANPDTYSITENTTNTLVPLNNDVVETPGGTLKIIAIAPTNGTATIIGGTNVVFVPATNFLGTATIGYTITDTIGGTNSSLITITVTNRPPLANPDTYSIAENTTNTLSPTPLSNDVLQTPGGTLAIITVAPTNGTATILGGTNVVFVPATNFLGSATIGYTITDGIGGTNSSLITITVTNRSPLANPDVYSMAENSTNTLTPLNNDVLETPGGTLTIIAVSPTNGTATILGGTNVSFIPTSNFIGTATIGYTITDGIGGTNSSLITVTVTNRPPTANPQSVMTPANTPVIISLTGSDPQSLPLTFVIVNSPTNGTLGNLNTNSGAVTYTPNTNYYGADTFTFLVNDGQTNSVKATVTLAISAAADVAVFKAGPASGTAGSNLVYTITVTNSGPATATNILVGDQLPTAFTFVSAVPTASVSNNLVSWPAFNLTNIGVRTFIVTATSSVNGTYTNVAFSTATTMDPNPTNNNGSSTNSQIVTSVTPAADVAIFNVGPAVAAPNGTIAYTLTATNFGPTTASNVVVQDTLPGGVIFQSATSGITPSAGILTWPSINMAPGTSAIFTVTVIVPANGVLVDIASSTATSFDPNVVNNNGTAAASRVTTTITAVADIQVLVVGPTNVAVGSGFSYVITVTNAGPSTASNILARDILPTNVIFSAASMAGVFSNNIVTWPVFASLTNSQATNLTLTVIPLGGASTNLPSPNLNTFNFIVSNTAPTVGFLTNIASAFATTFDPNLTNNVGSSSYTNGQAQTQIVPGVFSVFVSTNMYPTNDGAVTNTIIPIPGHVNLFLVSRSAWNPVTQLYEEDVSITNLSSALVYALRLYVGVPNGVILYNATGTNNGMPYVEYDPLPGMPLYNTPPYNAPSNNVTFALEFYVPNGQPFTNSLSVTASLVPPAQAPSIGTNSVNIYPDPRYPAGQSRFFIQFPSVPGRTYTIIYSDDLTTWYSAVPSIVASATSTIWYDDGPPETISKPGTVAARYYQVILDP
ncbi:MAG TPA: tandem-95 repeat protein [Verrucomicrobiae bacterium]|jgi:uncharacterized repeat protein (TIGR01451 family)